MENQGAAGAFQLSQEVDDEHLGRRVPSSSFSLLPPISESSPMDISRIL